MNRARRRAAFGIFAAGATCAVLSLPSASADPVEPSTPVAPPAAAADDCTAAGLAKTISSVTAAQETYFAAHPDLNQQLIEFTRQSAFSAMGSFNDYFKEHPEQADELRVIQGPLGAFKDRCGMQVAPTDALAVLGDL
ncbi:MULTISPECIES: hemophore-related protein [unclassified Mycobacterium]|uniref:hemophore-related protein n=1 Tax=unclassified Mycobacterium TaxID=2642494 RepID=UPI0029C73504|nr:MULTISPECIES: hemophore-related protein [unclassified Mycobacterium]